MNFLMNLTHQLGIALILPVGGLLVVAGKTEVGTVAAFVSGLAAVKDLWGDLVAWFQNLMVTNAKYRLIFEAIGKMFVTRSFARSDQSLKTARDSLAP